MTRLSTLILAVLLISATLWPAMAQDQAAPNLTTTGKGTQGGVAGLILAHQLYALGIANIDPLTVLNAARLATSVSLTDTARPRESSAAPATVTTSNPITPAEMFATANVLALDNEVVLDLIETSLREAPFIPLTNVISTESSVAAKQTETWPLPFFGNSLAEVAILGSGASNLHIKITDENGNPVCQDSGPSDTAYCSFYPAQNGTFLITVNNAGDSAISYLLLTN
jgi:hypothetical protein